MNPRLEPSMDVGSTQCGSGPAGRTADGVSQGAFWNPTTPLLLAPTRRTALSLQRQGLGRWAPVGYDVEATPRSDSKICVGSSRIVKSGSTNALRIRPSVSMTYVAGMGSIQTGEPCLAPKSDPSPE